MSLIVNEYMCPHHGRFESLVERSTAPDVVPCPIVCAEWEWHEVGPSGPTCDEPSPWCISAPATHLPVATVQRGTSDERPPWALDTRPLADGMPMREWKAREQAKNRETVRTKLRKELL